MELLKKVCSFFSNKLFLYLLTRYLVYAIQFLSLLFLAARLGPYYYGIWGFILMLIGYFQILNFGIANSLNIYLVQYKGDSQKCNDFIKSAFGAVGLQTVLLMLIACVYSFVNFPIFEKYHVGNLFYIVCMIAGLQYVNIVCCNIYRVKNRLFELAFYQSSIPLLVFITIFFAEEELLLYCLLGAYFFAHILSMGIFLFRGEISFAGHCTWKFVKAIFGKGFFLFLYNSCFYLILTTTSFVISYNYSVEEYGLYSFSYSLGHAVLLMLEAFTFVIFPKLIDRFHLGDNNEIISLLGIVRVNYIVLSHGLMYVAISLFPFLLLLFPKFHNALSALILTAISVLLSTNAFGYNTLLIARNKEKKVSIASVIALSVNISAALIISLIFNAPFYCVMLSVMVSYALFALICAFLAKRELALHFRFFLLANELFPFSLIIPYVSAIVIAFLGKGVFCFIPLLLFVLFNYSSLKKIIFTFKRLSDNPDVINV